MLKLFLAAALAALPLVSAPTAATQPCGTNNADVYNDLGAAGCSITIPNVPNAVFTISNFEWNSASGGNFVPVSPAEVLITPLGNGSLGLGFESSSFDITGDQRILATLFYTIDPPPPILDSFDLFLDSFSPVAPGFARVTALICAGAFFSNNCAGGATGIATVEHLGNVSTLFDSFDFPGTVNILDVRLTLDMRANGASSQIDGARQVTTLAPEPSAGLLAMLGLGLLSFVARAKARRS